MQRRTRLLSSSCLRNALKPPVSMQAIQLQTASVTRAIQCYLFSRQKALQERSIFRRDAYNAV
jgi:hypothetical protein